MKITGKRLTPDSYLGGIFHGLTRKRNKQQNQVKKTAWSFWFWLLLD
jgi:hypothetical protein